jgi:KDO2-lipid IV(A) lauroyltransferase
MKERRLRRLYKASPRLRRLSRRARSAVLGSLVRAALAALSKLSLERALWLGARVGGVMYRALPGMRRLALEHLELAFGDALSVQERERIARAAVENAGRCFCELAKIDEIRRRPDYIEFDGEASMQEALARGKGAIVVTGHVGNWELLGAYFAWRGMEVAAVARHIYVEGLNDLLLELRDRQGVQTILRESADAGRRILRVLKSSGVLALLIDQDTRAPSLSVPFFGKPARTPIAAAALALRREVPVGAVFIHRRPAGGHRIVIRQVFDPPATTDRLEALRELTTAFSAALEAQIREHPEEWVWWHRRWRRAPVPHLDADAPLQ